ncbi:MAG: hypothetical protein IPP22_09385 [Nitrosomonas sp.]|nr:hypothetical protein [Nitrosomonas sp.]
MRGGGAGAVSGSWCRKKHVEQKTEKPGNRGAADVAIWLKTIDQILGRAL